MTSLHHLTDLIWPRAANGFLDMPLFHEPSKIGECEFWLISEMSSQLIVHQPYRTLTSLQSSLNLTSDELALAWSIVNDHYMTDLPLIYPPHTIALTAILLAIVFRPSQNTAGQAGSSSGQGAGSAASAMGQASVAGVNAVTAALAQAQARQQPPTPGAVPGQTGPGQQAGTDGASNAHKIERFSKVQRFGFWLAESNIDIEAMIDCTQELISFYDCQEQYNDKLTREQIVRFIKARGLDKG